MHLDVLTLMAAGSFVAFIGGLLLVGAWTQMRSTPALLWWAAAELMTSVGVGVLAAGFAGGNEGAVAVGTAFVACSAAVAWAAVRRFEHRPVYPALLAAVPLAWFAAGFVPLPGGRPVAAVTGTFAISVAFLLAAIVELWRGRGERLGARWPLAVIVGLHAAIYAGGIVDVLTGHMSPNVVPALNSWFSLIHFEQLIFLIGSAILMIVMSRERTEQSYIEAARVDSLTGAVNRGAFFEYAVRMLHRCHEDESPTSLIIFDLDHFKQVNDTRGHRVGDQVLRAFADTARATLRPGDLFGRVGGEEFAVILPSTACEVACVIAERVRHAFATAPHESDGAIFHVTVSAGVARASHDDSVEDLLEAADRALYRAKALGRNRIERAGDGPTGDDSNVIRVA